MAHRLKRQHLTWVVGNFHPLELVRFNGTCSVAWTDSSFRGCTVNNFWRDPIGSDSFADEFKETGGTELNYTLLEYPHWLLCKEQCYAYRTPVFMFVTRSDVTKGEADVLRRAKLMVESGLNWKSCANVGHKTASLLLTPVESKTADEETIDLAAFTGKAFFHGTESFLVHEKKYR